MPETKTRTEYPRPQFERSSWISLNGAWEFQFDDDQCGVHERWFTQKSLKQHIQVPFCYQSQLSGIGTSKFHDTVWYKRKFNVPASFEGKRILLHFGAVDYLAEVWVNGHFVVSHEGGHTPFQTDVTNVLVYGQENDVTVRVQDFSRDVTLPRGKQYWKEKSEKIFYTSTTGIWQSVWLEAVSPIYLQNVYYYPNIDRNEIGIRYVVGGWRESAEVRVRTEITFEGELMADDECLLAEPKQKRMIQLHDFNDHGMGRWWSPDSPHLYDVKYTLTVDGIIVDSVRSYFGMRKISVDNGKLCLNNRPFYMKAVLDQGYFPDGLLTAPSDDALRRDVELIKAMGFNGVRIHQKVEDPRFLHWCNKLGLVVWGEAANAYAYSESYVKRFTKEWIDVIERDFNHPSIIVWVPLNESWGVPNIKVDRQQQQHALAMYYTTKSLDPTRLVISNDGWEHVKSDLCTIHDYEWRYGVLRERYGQVGTALDAPQKRDIYVLGFSYAGEPILVTEFGGISFQKSHWSGWGYSGATSEKDFVGRLTSVMKAVQESTLLQGYCYTQFTDVEQEINGLLTYDRKPKIELDTIKRINEGIFD